MQTQEKITFKTFTKLKKNEVLTNVIRKLTLSQQLDYKEKTYILSIALIFIKFYEKDKRKTNYVEFAYYIILKYSLIHQDYKPLYDFSVEFGFFPIAKSIFDNDLISGSLGLRDMLIKQTLEQYFTENQITYTLEQSNVKNNILNDTSDEMAFIAPTSYGKSSVIISLINKHYKNDKNIKIAIIVPSKSLIIQTFNLLKKQNINKKILLHDEMYNNEQTFIAVFTQERALRFLKKQNGIAFDIIFIDEAHKIFYKDPRTILLSRFIKKNKQKNSGSKFIYLSPLIFDANNIRLTNKQQITEQKIQFNIKEADFFIHEKNTTSKYNRFLDEFYDLNENYDDYLSYIKQNSKNKNLIYLKSPKKIEEFSIELSNSFQETNELDDLVEVLNENIHNKFYLTQLLKKGIIYLHGKMPEIVKEYLEYKFKTNSSLKYIIANTVILEGVNLPIDNMFILNTHSLSIKDLTNLIGRVNRLNEIFTTNRNNLSLLSPTIHFIESKYQARNTNIKNKIKKLRSNSLEDEIKNPLLDQCPNKNEPDNQKIIKNEEFLNQPTENKEDKLEQYLIENDIYHFYGNENNLVRNILLKLNNIDIENWKSLNLIEKIYEIFVKDFEKDIIDDEFKRLKNEATKNYYKYWFETLRFKSLKDQIIDSYEHLKKIAKSGQPKSYFGETYGEETYNKGKKKVYINLSIKNDDDIINLAIVKLCIEENFVSFKLNKLIEMLYHYELLTEQEYNLCIYGSEEREHINLIRAGLTISLINRLKKDNQLENISLDENGNLKSNDKFKQFLCTIDDFYRFQLKKFIS